MDCGHLPQTDPTANPKPNPDPNPNPSPNPYLFPQLHIPHSAPCDAYQYYTAAPADPTNAMFTPQYQPQQPSIHYPYAPPPATAGHVPLQLVSSNSHAAASYYTDPFVNTTFAAGHYAPGASDYAAFNGVGAPSSVTLQQSTVSQKKGTKKKKNKIPIPHAWCDVCNIDCTSKDVLDIHRQGKKHKKNLLKLRSVGINPVIACNPPPPLLSAPLTADAPHLPLTVATSTPIFSPQVSSPMVAASPPSIDEPTVEPRAPSPGFATSSPLPYSNPTSPGKQPIIGPQESPTASSFSSMPLSVSISASTDQPTIAPSPPKVATSNPLPSSDPTSPGDKPVIEPQEPQIATASSSTPFSVPTSASTDQPVIGPQVEKARSSSRKSSKKRGRAASSIEDFEMKRRKVLENGTSAEDVHVCDVCNVVCNSETVLKSHLAGRKHASAAMKKLASAGVATSTTT